MNYNTEARKVTGFNTSVIPKVSREDREYLADYNRRSDDKDLLNNPTSKENKRYFRIVMLTNANRFATKAKYTPSLFGILRKMKLNYEDVAEANYLAYLANK
jgi:hypothetical protein